MKWIKNIFCLLVFSFFAYLGLGKTTSPVSEFSFENSIPSEVPTYQNFILFQYDAILQPQIEYNLFNGHHFLKNYGLKWFDCFQIQSIDSFTSIITNYCVNPEFHIQKIALLLFPFHFFW
ncbi:hypothetical protein [Flavobacterium sp. '19STA2R22 D10 B1']|uniref:hypothetical protein n=1 Tax=Flavobacterium aerium TaxID=3037261 RepID=UPI00278C47AF|nr:hypothetical protein [Flavobacterium sp. '19STA2R22 D10 B1']